MKTILAILVASSLLAHAQKPEIKLANPPYCTPQEIKVFWYDQMPVPRTLDRDFKALTEARSLFVLDVKAGRYDLAASKAAAEYNLNAATKRGDEVGIAKFGDQLRACEKIIAENEQRQREAEARAEMAAVRQEQRDLTASMEQARRDLQTAQFELERERSKARMLKQQQMDNDMMDHN